METLRWKIPNLRYFLVNILSFSYVTITNHIFSYSYSTIFTLLQLISTLPDPIWTWVNNWNYELLIFLLEWRKKLGTLGAVILFSLFTLDSYCPGSLNNVQSRTSSSQKFDESQSNSGFHGTLSSYSCENTPADLVIFSWWKMVNTSLKNRFFSNYSI